MNNKKMIVFLIIVVLAFPLYSFADINSQMIEDINDGLYTLVLDNLASGANPNHRERGAPALLHAAVFGNVEVVELLLSRGARINDVDSREGKTALICAVIKGHYSVVKLLLNRGADSKIKDGNMVNALYYAENNKDKKIIKALKEHEKQKKLLIDISKNQEIKQNILPAVAGIGSNLNVSRYDILLAAAKSDYCLKAENDNLLDNGKKRIMFRSGKTFLIEAIGPNKDLEVITFTFGLNKELVIKNLARLFIFSKIIFNDKNNDFYKWMAIYLNKMEKAKTIIDNKKISLNPVQLLGLVFVTIEK